MVSMRSCPDSAALTKRLTYPTWKRTFGPMRKKQSIILQCNAIVSTSYVV